MTTLIIAEDHILVSDCMAAALTGDEFRVVACVRDGLAALDAVREHRPDLCLIDINLPGMQGLEVAKEVLKSTPNCRIAMITSRAEVKLVREAITAGATGFVLKSEGLSALRTALRLVSTGGIYVTPSLLGSMMTQWSRGIGCESQEVLLTLRERQVLKLIAEGSTTKDIGGALGISAKTADGHRVRMMAKLKVHDLSAVVRYAIREGIVEA